MGDDDGLGSLLVRTTSEPRTTNGATAGRKTLRNIGISSLGVPQCKPTSGVHRHETFVLEPCPCTHLRGCSRSRPSSTPDLARHWADSHRQKPCSVYCLTPKGLSLRRPPEFAVPLPGRWELPDMAPLCVKSAAFPPVDGAPALAAVKQTALDCGCGSALGQGVGNAANKGLGQR